MTEEKLTQAENTISGICKYCGGDISKANPTGNCNHVYYPENVNRNLIYEPNPEYVQSRAPILGLMPVKIAEERRVIDICMAMIRYAEAGSVPPVEWAQELLDLSKRLDARDTKEDE